MKQNSFLSRFIVAMALCHGLLSAAVIPSTPFNCCPDVCVDFNTLLPGDTLAAINAKLPGITFSTTNPQGLVIFNSTNPTCGQFALGSPNGFAIPGGKGVGSGGASGVCINNTSLGNVLVMTSANVCQPSATSAPGTITLIFACPVTLTQICALNVCDSASNIKMFDINGLPLSQQNFFACGTNGYQTLMLNQPNVKRLEVFFNGMSALSCICFRCEVIDLAARSCCETLSSIVGQLVTCCDSNTSIINTLETRVAALETCCEQNTSRIERLETCCEANSNSISLLDFCCANAQSRLEQLECPRCCPEICIDFAKYASGANQATINAGLCGISISAVGNNCPGCQAFIYDTDNPDVALSNPGTKLLIISDNNPLRSNLTGGVITFTFQCPVSIDVVNVLDIDAPSSISLFDGANALLAVVPIPQETPAQEGVVVPIPVNQPGVTRMEINLATTGGIASVCFHCEVIDVAARSCCDNAQSRIALLETCCDQNTSLINNLETRVAGLETCCDENRLCCSLVEQQINNLTTIVDRSVTQIENLQSCCDANSSSIAELQTCCDVNTNAISILDLCCANAQSRLERLEFPNCCPFCLNFNLAGLQPGDTQATINSKLVGVQITAVGANGGGAMIYDSSSFTLTNHEDLGTPNDKHGGPGLEENIFDTNNIARGNVLIINDNVLPLQQSADLNGGSITFTFTCAVVVDSLGILDIEAEDQPASITLFDPNNNIIAVIPIPTLHDNGFQTIAINTPNVSRMVVTFQGQAAITDLCFHCEVIDLAARSCCELLRSIIENLVISTSCCDRIPALETCCEQNASNIEILFSLIDNLQTCSNCIATGLEQLQSCCDNHETRIEALESCCEEVRSEVDVINNQLSILDVCCGANTTCCDNLTSRVEALECQSCCPKRFCVDFSDFPNTANPDIINAKLSCIGVTLSGGIIFQGVFPPVTSEQLPCLSQTTDKFYGFSNPQPLAITFNCGSVILENIGLDTGGSFGATVSLFDDKNNKFKVINVPGSSGPQNVAINQSGVHRVEILANLNESAVLYCFCFTCETVDLTARSILEFQQTEIDTLFSLVDLVQSCTGCIATGLEQLQSCCDNHETRIEALESCCEQNTSAISLLDLCCVQNLSCCDILTSIVAGIESELGPIRTCCDAVLICCNQNASAIEQLESCCEGNTTRIDNLQSCCDNHETRIEALESCCEDVRSIIEFQQTEIDTLFSLIDLVQSCTGCIATGLEQLQSCCDNHETRIEALESCCDQVRSRLDVLECQCCPKRFCVDFSKFNPGDTADMVNATLCGVRFSATSLDCGEESICSDQVFSATLLGFTETFSGSCLSQPTSNLFGVINQETGPVTRQDIVITFTCPVVVERIGFVVQNLEGIICGIGAKFIRITGQDAQGNTVYQFVPARSVLPGPTQTGFYDQPLPAVGISTLILQVGCFESGLACVCYHCETVDVMARSLIDLQQTQIDDLITCCDNHETRIEALETCCEQNSANINTLQSCCDEVRSRLDILECPSCCTQPICIDFSNFAQGQTENDFNTKYSSCGLSITTACGAEGCIGTVYDTSNFGVGTISDGCLSKPTTNVFGPFASGSPQIGDTTINFTECSVHVDTIGLVGSTEGGSNVTINTYDRVGNQLPVSYSNIPIVGYQVITIDQANVASVIITITSEVGSAALACFCFHCETVDTTARSLIDFQQTEINNLISCCDEVRSRLDVLEAPQCCPRNICVDFSNTAENTINPSFNSGFITITNGTVVSLCQTNSLIPDNFSCLSQQTDLALQIPAPITPTTINFACPVTFNTIGLSEFCPTSNCNCLRNGFVILTMTFKDNAGNILKVEEAAIDPANPTTEVTINQSGVSSIEIAKAPANLPAQVVCFCFQCDVVDATARSLADFQQTEINTLQSCCEEVRSQIDVINSILSPFGQLVFTAQNMTPLSLEFLPQSINTTPPTNLYISNMIQFLAPPAINSATIAFGLPEDVDPAGPIELDIHFFTDSLVSSTGTVTINLQTQFINDSIAISSTAGNTFTSSNNLSRTVVNAATNYLVHYKITIPITISVTNPPLPQDWAVLSFMRTTPNSYTGDIYISSAVFRYKKLV